MERIFAGIKDRIHYLFQVLGHKFYFVGDTLAIDSPRKARLIIISVLSCVLLLSGFGVYRLFFAKKKDAGSGNDLIQVKAQKTKKENFAEKYTVMGTLKGSIENELRFEIDGVLSTYNFREGARIGRGQTICSLDPKDSFTKADYARSRYSSERSTYYSAVQRLKVYEELFRMKAIAESKLQEARFEIQAAESRMKAALSELELAQSNLSKTNLSAPSDGMLAEIIIKSGDYVTPQDVVAKFISGGDTVFEVDVPEKDVNQIKIGMKAKIKCDSYPDREFDGTVTEIAPTVKEKTRTTLVRINIPDTDHLLRSGMFGRGEIYLVEMENVIMVPNDSVVALGDSTYLVPLVKPDPEIPGEGKIEMRHVQIGKKMADKTVIADGILPDEMVVTETQGQLSDDLQVKFTEVVASQDKQLSMAE